MVGFVCIHVSVGTEVCVLFVNMTNHEYVNMFLFFFISECMKKCDRLLERLFFISECMKCMRKSVRLWESAVMRKNDGK